MKNNRLVIIGVCLIIIFSIVGGAVLKQRKARHYKNSYVPTIIFMDKANNGGKNISLANKIKNKGVTSNICQFSIVKDNKIVVRGNSRSKTLNPIIQVKGQKLTVNSIDKVMKKAKSIYHTKNYNIILLYGVANTYFDYLVRQKRSNIKLNNLICIAGDFAFNEDKSLIIDHSGKPDYISKNYRKFLLLRHNKMLNQTRVLNIMGNNSDNSDGIVLNASSKALKYLVYPETSVYVEKVITGKNSEHFQLIKNKLVEQTIIDFLWLNK
ncbi:alpha/beta hydrolase [Limosilactobacillus caviae]|uniref:alpha/beta hydrolase n=1 Tax=Limosilactobacillus caviae TaxID=1769424 RepID=UPI00351833D3